MIIGNKTFDFKKTAYIMGILNVTPDSFSDGGHYNNLDNALFHAQQLIQEGAAIIDVGGESTRPGHTPLSKEEEIQRVVPIIEAIHQRFDIPISIDTSKATVAKAALDAGASLVNDVWGFLKDPDIAQVTADYNVPCCLMHNRHHATYNNLMLDMIDDLNHCIRVATEAGVAKEQIILDPGIGFAKTLDDNLHVMRHLENLVTMGYPILLGTSRKSMIGLTLDLPVDQRVEGTVATTLLGYMKGCRLFRVHDVKENYRALKMLMAMS